MSPDSNSDDTLSRSGGEPVEVRFSTPEYCNPVIKELAFRCCVGVVCVISETGFYYGKQNDEGINHSDHDGL